MEGSLLGKKPADWLKVRMSNSGNLSAETINNAPRISGQIIPFEITEDWKQADDEQAWSCQAVMIFFDGESYIKDESDNPVDVILYSPLDLNEKPSLTVGDRCFAVIRGNHWEVIGGAGGNFFFEERLNSTLTQNHVAITESGKFVYMPKLFPDRAVEIWRRILFRPIKGKIAPFVVENIERMSEFASFEVPIVNISYNVINSIANISIQKPFGVPSNAYIVTKYDGITLKTTADQSFSLGFATEIRTYIEGITISQFNRTINSPTIFTDTFGVGSNGVIADPLPGTYDPSTEITLELKPEINSQGDYKISWKWGDDEDEFQLYDDFVPMPSILDEPTTLYVQLIYKGIYLDPIKIGNYTSSE